MADFLYRNWLFQSASYSCFPSKNFWNGCTLSVGGYSLLSETLKEDCLQRPYCERGWLLSCRNETSENRLNSSTRSIQRTPRDKTITSVTTIYPNVTPNWPEMWFIRVSRLCVRSATLRVPSEQKIYNNLSGSTDGNKLQCIYCTPINK